MCGQPMSDWLEIWQGTYWSHFKMIHRLCLGNHGPGELYRREAWFGCRRSEVRPNDFEMARNFLCTPLLAVWKNLAVFVWFWQDLIFGSSIAYLWQVATSCSSLDLEEAKWHFWCQQMPPRGTAASCLTFVVDVPRRDFWRRACDLTKSLWAVFLFGICSLLSFQGNFMVVKGITYHLEAKFWRWHQGCGFGFWPCDLTGYMWQVRGSGLVLIVWPNKLYVECWGINFGFDLVT